MTHMRPHAARSGGLDTGSAMPDMPDTSMHQDTPRRALRDANPVIPRDSTALVGQPTGNAATEVN